MISNIINAVNMYSLNEKEDSESALLNDVLEVLTSEHNQLYFENFPPNWDVMVNSFVTRKNELQ